MYSIVIPTYNHCDDLLKPCLESIFKYTSDFEIIVVANGCTDNTREYVLSLAQADPRIKLIWSDEPLGYTKATNLGITAATREFVVLLNNDIILLDQPIDQWLNLLVEPFQRDPTVGVTGPVKFHWQVAGIRREAMAFWLVMIPRALFDKIGILDEIFSPGMGEDGDFCIRAVQAGYKLVSVPQDVSGGFESGIVNFGFPIWHKGNGTFADDESAKFSVIDRNNKVLEDYFGIGDYFVPLGYKTNPVEFFDDSQNTDGWQREVYQYARVVLFQNDYRKILDIGCGSGFKLLEYFADEETVGVDLPQTIAKVRAKYPHKRWVEHDLESSVVPAELQQEFDLVICADVIEHLQNPDALLKFIQQLKFKDIIFSTPDRGLIERNGGPRLGPPANPCHVREWNRREFGRYLQNSGFQIQRAFISNREQVTQLAHCTPKRPEISIIIPTYNHYEDAFKPCIDAVLAYTDLSDKEVIVVANGCKPDDLTRTHLEELAGTVRYVWSSKPEGYIGAVNLGIDASLGKYIVLLDNDSHLLPQPRDMWIGILKKPFLEQDKVGATSPFANEYEDLGFVLHSGCTMYDAALLRKIGKFDPVYMPGYFSDSDVAMKIWRAGYRCIEVPFDRAEKKYENGTFTISFPVCHTGLVQTMDKNADIEIVRRNRELLYSRYGKNRQMKKYSIVIPTYNHCDDLLRPCIESIARYTNMDDVELIVSANGCTDNTREYLDSLGELVKVAWSDEPLGYTKATNAGIKLATGTYVVLLNNDTELLPQTQSKWLEMMVEPFESNPAVGMTGPLMLHDDYADADVIIFFCAMIKREVFDKIGLLDEIYSPGGGEDIDFTIRCRAAGYEVAAIEAKFDPTKSTNVGNVPIWHKDNQTFKNIPEYTNWIVKRNGHLNAKRYNKNIKLNLGSGGVPYKGWLSVDLYDKRAHIQADITKLDFDDNSVTEILASHVFEHLNPYHSLDILKEWRRVLKPGGKLIMEMPDIEQLCKAFIATNDTGRRYGILNAIYGSVNTTGEGGPDNITSPHLFGWWPASLWDHLTNAGFVNIQFMEEQIPHPEKNLRVEATNPGGVPAKPVDRTRYIDHAQLKAEEPGTFIELFEQNSYQVTVDDVKDRVLIDVGANLGMFSLLCVEKGLRQSIAVEAQADVFNLGLKRITAPYPMITPIHAAVYDEDDKTVLISNEHVGSKVNAPYGGDPVQTITLQTLLTRHGLLDSPDLILKLDCEGSEFPILLTTPIEVLQKFHIVYIEIHNNFNQNPDHRDAETVRNRLREVGLKQVSLCPIMWFNEQGQATHEIGVYVEKWVRA